MYSIEYIGNMDASRVVDEILAASELGKSKLSSQSGISRALIDDYLKSRKQPGLPQLDRLATAAGLVAKLRIEGPLVPVPSAFIEVLEFGELFETPADDPLPNLTGIWRRPA
jgi:transcriptional regulator with XRE-family HTH domain